jgi:nicotinamidase-related amidase
MGRLLVRGEYGHDIIDELAPRPGELVIDKPGKGSFWGTSLNRDLLARGITHLLVAGVTTEYGALPSGICNQDAKMPYVGAV